MIIVDIYGIQINVLIYAYIVETIKLINIPISMSPTDHFEIYNTLLTVVITQGNSSLKLIPLV
jgi:hypothetical protein